MKKSFLSYLSKLNWGLLAPAFLLTLFGLVSIYSSSISGGDFSSFKKQLVFFAVSISFVIFLNFVDLRFLRTNSYLILSLYAVSLAALAGLLFWGAKIRGVKGWYHLAGFSFDPAPFSVIVLIIVLSKYFSMRHLEIQRFQPILFSGLYSFIPALLVLRQPDLGSSVCFVIVWLGIIIFSGIKLRHFLILTLIFLLLFCLGWKLWLKDYQKQRILSFLNPQANKRGISWNINQSKIAIGSGGLLGRGIGKGSQTQYGFLPESKTDFIFPAIAEETGFLGVTFLFGLFGFLLWKIIGLAQRAGNNFLRLFASGFAFLVLSQTFINIGMSLGLLPIVGIPLPFVSYGGSYLFAFYLGLGILSSLNKF